MANHSQRVNIWTAALLTPLFMGLTPIFAKLAIHAGIDPYTLSALRTGLAALLLWAVFLLFFRKYVYIFPAGLLGTIVVGAVNGFGSLMYYNGLLLLDNASLAQLLNMLYVIFAMLLVRFYGQQVSLLSVGRAALALLAVYLLVGDNGQGQVRWIGVGLMIVSAFAYALHIVLSQRVMFEMPAPTMALYALTFMSVTVIAARLIYGAFFPLPLGPAVPQGWYFIAGLTAVTALSRVTLFAGVRSLGSLQAILLNVAETAVTLVAAFFWLEERMTILQWIGVGVLVLSVLLSRWDTAVRDLVYRPLPVPAPLSGLPLGDPLKPDRFSIVTKLYRRKPRQDAVLKK